VPYDPIAFDAERWKVADQKERGRMVFGLFPPGDYRADEGDLLSPASPLYGLGREEVRELLGEPDVTSDNLGSWVYHVGSLKWREGSWMGPMYMLVIRFDEKGIVYRAGVGG